MSEEDLENTPVSHVDEQPARLGRSGFLIFYLILLAVGAVATAGFVLAKKQLPAEEKPDSGAGEAPSKELKEFAAKYFPTWPADRKPELLLFFSGEQHNYEAPCGCTMPQYGGLERRYNLMTEMRKLGLKIVAMDLGDIYTRGPVTDQARLKYYYSMKALNLMGYDAVTVGPEEMRFPLLEALATTVLQHNYSYAILAANIMPKKTEFPGLNTPTMLEDYRVVEPKDCKIKVGIVGTLGQSVVDEVAKAVIAVNNPAQFQQAKNDYFGNNSAVLPAVLKEMQAKNPDVKVLLYQGTEDEAKKLAEKIGDFDVILHRSAGSEPAGAVIKVGRTQIVEVGHKGRIVGVMALFRSVSGGFDYRWTLVPLDKEFKTEKDQQATNAAVKLLEDYTKEVKDRDFLARYPKVLHPLQSQFPNAKFIGSEACKKCHDDEYQTWEGSKHANSVVTLSEHPRAKPPHNRRYDSECLICHSTGLGYQTGFVNEERTKHLANMGCEMCHGPGSAHASNKNNNQLRLAMSPWKVKPTDTIKDKAIENKVFQMCIKCHDTDNDHDFDFDKRWKAIAHGPSAKKNAGGK